MPFFAVSSPVVFNVVVVLIASADTAFRVVCPQTGRTDPANVVNIFCVAAISVHYVSAVTPGIAFIKAVLAVYITVHILRFIFGNSPATGTARTPTGLGEELAFIIPCGTVQGVVNVGIFLFILIRVQGFRFGLVIVGKRVHIRDFFIVMFVDTMCFQPQARHILHRIIGPHIVVLIELLFQLADIPMPFRPNLERCKNICIGKVNSVHQTEHFTRVHILNPFVDKGTSCNIPPVPAYEDAGVGQVVIQFK